ncbi:MAG: hypothetical protein PHQ59_05115 [Candidatus Daviesbacteria bacterium]|nr:hypothetical protein [Candidatus Daviesbacteria bacterium]
MKENRLNITLGNYFDPYDPMYSYNDLDLIEKGKFILGPKLPLAFPEIGGIATINWSCRYSEVATYPKTFFGRILRDDYYSQNINESDLAKERNSTFPWMIVYLKRSVISGLIEGGLEKLELVTLLKDQQTGMTYIGTTQDGRLDIIDQYSNPSRASSINIGWLVDCWRGIEDSPKRLEQAWKEKRGDDYQWNGAGEVLLVPKENKPPLEMMFTLKH